MARYSFGRNPDSSQQRIVIDDDSDRTVSRQHGTISPVGGSRYKLTDSDSAGGTFIREKGGWRRISTAEVGADDEIRLGKYVTSVRHLLNRVAKQSKPDEDDVDMKVERDPDTGEIIKREK